MAEELRGRKLRISQRMKTLRTTGLFGLDWADQLFHAWGAGLLIVPTLFSYLLPDLWEPILFKAAIVGLGMLLTTLVGRVSVAAYEAQRLNFLLWDILTDKDKDEGYAIGDYPRARLRELLGLDPEK